MNNLVKIIVGITGLLTFLYMLKMSSRQTSKMDNLIPICVSDEINLLVSEVKRYNGVVEINGVYNLDLMRLVCGEETFLLPDDNSLDSIVKKQDSSFMELIMKDGQKFNCEGIFRCN